MELFYLNSYNIIMGNCICARPQPVIVKRTEPRSPDSDEILAMKHRVFARKSMNAPLLKIEINVLYLKRKSLKKDCDH